MECPGGASPGGGWGVMGWRRRLYAHLRVYNGEVDFMIADAINFSNDYTVHRSMIRDIQQLKGENTKDAVVLEEAMSKAKYMKPFCFHS